MRSASCFTVVLAMLAAAACSDVDNLTARLDDDDIDCGIIGAEAFEQCAATLACLAPAIESNCETAAHVQQYESDFEGGLTISDYFFLPSDDGGACELHVVTEDKPDRYDWIGGGSYKRCSSFTLLPSDTTACRSPIATTDTCEVISSR